MDTRPVFHGDHQHPEVKAALHDNPDLPVLGKAYHGLVFVRLLMHPDLISNDLYIRQWANRIAQALQANCDCFMMIHRPNNQHCPSLAYDFHEQLCACTIWVKNSHRLSPGQFRNNISYCNWQSVVL